MAIKCFTVAVTSIGTPQSIASLISAQLPQVSGSLAGPVELRGNVVNMQADPGNTAAKNVYVGSSNMNTGTRVGIGAALAPGAFAPGVYVEGTTSIYDLYIDADAAATTRNLFVMVVG